MLRGDAGRPWRARVDGARLRGGRVPTGPPGMLTSTFLPAAELPYRELAPLFERSFAEYIVPIRATPSGTEARNRIEHVDLFASQIALHGHAPVGLALIARRGRTSRVAAMGVIPEARGTGVARQLLARVIDDARLRGDRSLILECIASNERALRLYRGAGFVVTRQLVGYRAGGLVAEPARVVEIDPAELGRRLARHDDGTLSWQLAPETLCGLTAPARGWTIDGTAVAVGSVLESEVALRAVFTPPEQRRRGHASRLLRGLAAAFAPLRLAMVPIVPERLGAELAVALGAARHELSQVEMAFPLDAAPAAVP